MAPMKSTEFSMCSLPLAWPGFKGSSQHRFLRNGKIQGMLLFLTPADWIELRKKDKHPRLPGCSSQAACTSHCTALSSYVVPFTFVRSHKSGTQSHITYFVTKLQLLSQLLFPEAPPGRALNTKFTPVLHQVLVRRLHASNREVSLRWEY